MDISVLGIDLGKNSCSVVGLDAIGKVVVRRRMRRETVITYAATLPACVVAMEACCGAHHMGRALARQGHAIRLMSPEYVRPYVKAQKNDDRDAEAATRPTMRFVELKTEEQLDMQTLHRIRDQLVGDRTSLMNQIRSLLLERGYIVPQGRAKLALRLGEMLDGDEPVLGSRIHRLVSDMRLRWSALDERIADLDAEFTDAARADERTRRLLTIPGIGALNATALVAAVGDARTFGRGRDLRMARLGAAAGNDRRQAAVAGYHQTWEPLPAQEPDPRCACVPAGHEQERYATWRLAARSPLTFSSQHRRGGIGRQDGAYRVGAAAARARLRSGCTSSLNKLGRRALRQLDDVCGR